MSAQPAKSGKATKAPERPAPRLYLATPLLADTAAFIEPLAAALKAADVAAVLLRLASNDERTLVKRIKILSALIQDAGAALILDNLPQLVARSGADGAHLSGIDAFEAAVGGLKPDRIAGVGGLVTRHDAMLAGEGGADYVLFGGPADDTPFADIQERIAWWAEVFEPACAGYAQNFDDAKTLAAAGADFILMGDAIWHDPRGAHDAAVDAANILRHTPGIMTGTVSPQR